MAEIPVFRVRTCCNKRMRRNVLPCPYLPHTSPQGGEKKEKQKQKDKSYPNNFAHPSCLSYFRKRQPSCRAARSLSPCKKSAMRVKAVGEAGWLRNFTETLCIGPFNQDSNEDDNQGEKANQPLIMFRPDKPGCNTIIMILFQSGAW